MVGGRLRPVKKTSLYLEPDIDRALARAAAAEGITKAALIRRTLAAVARPSQRPRPSGAAIFDGPRDLATRTDEALAQDGFGER